MGTLGVGTKALHDIKAVPGSKQEISPHPRFSLFQVNGYTFENKKYICGTTSVPIQSLHKAPETPPRGLRGQASKRASLTRQSDAPQGACV